MAGLLGSLVAGAAQGGAAAQQKSLFDEINEQRKLSFAKIQQEYAQENAEFTDNLAGKRNDTEYGREVSYLSNDNSQAITNAEFNALPPEKQAGFQRLEVAASKAAAAKDDRENRKLDLQEEKNDAYMQALLRKGADGGSDRTGYDPKKDYLTALGKYSDFYKDNMDMSDAEKADIIDRKAREFSGYWNGYTEQSEKQPESEQKEKNLWDKLTSSFGREEEKPKAILDSAENTSKQDSKNNTVRVEHEGQSYDIPKDRVEEFWSTRGGKGKGENNSKKGILPERTIPSADPDTTPEQKAKIKQKYELIEQAKKTMEQAKKEKNLKKKAALEKEARRLAQGDVGNIL